MVCFVFRSRMAAAGVAAICLVGCERAEPLQWSSSNTVQELPRELRDAVTAIVREEAGTASAPMLVTSDDASFATELHLKQGQAVYMRRCLQCHGMSGGGDGPAADFLYPRPRDYTKGVFKFTSTQYGGRPRREDLIATLKRGVVGTSMPSFSILPEEDIEAVVDYVIVLSQRGELEYQLALEAEGYEDPEPEDIEEFLEYAPDSIDLVETRWQAAEGDLTQPLTPQPRLTTERVAAGREAFLSKGCSKCHGDDGRGHTKDNIGSDSWGYPTRAADLTSGMLRGGQQPVDVYRRILNGINGTPMPGFKSALQSEPETIWNLVAYVLHVSNRRREGEAIPAGLMKPYDTGAITEDSAEE